MPENNITIPRIGNKAVKSQNVENYKLICYYNFPNENYNFKKQLLDRHIDPNLCTHLNIGFGSVFNNTIYLTDFQKNVTKSLVNLKTQNQNLKVLLSISGTSVSGFTEMVLNHANRKM